MDTLNLADLLTRAIGDADARIGSVNVLIAGRTGVGKSTLVNTVFHSRLAETGQGESVTKTTRMIQKEGVPLRVFDTRGLEMADFMETLESLTQLVDERSRSADINDHIHCAWLCIAEPGRRVERAEQELCRALAGHMPVVGVVTKASADQGFRADVQRLLPETKNIVRVHAVEERLDDGHSLPTMGLEDLVELTASLLPEGVQDAIAAAQQVSLELKVEHARTVVGRATASAAAAAAVPLPFASAAALVPILIGMLASISRIFGLKTSTTALNGVVGTVLSATGTTIAVRTAIANAMKLIPGAGSVTGGVIGAATAATLTTAVGELYIQSLKAVVQRKPGQTPTLEAVSSEFDTQVRTATPASWWKWIWPRK